MKDIKDVLHLYFYQEIEISEVFINVGYKVGQRFVPTGGEMQLALRENPIFACKPILRRLSSMDDSEKLEVCIINPKLDDNQIAAARTVYLLSKGFWLFDESAFDQGIIIDKATI